MNFLNTQSLGMHLQKDLVASVESSNTADLFHGPNGLFNDCCIERDVISAECVPYGIMEILPAFRSLDENPVFAYITAINADDDSIEPETDCEDGPSGYYEGCKTTCTFGKVQRSTKTVAINEVIGRLCRGDTRDLVLHGSLIGNMGGLAIRGMNETQLLNVVLQSEMVKVGRLFNIKLNQLLWSGDTANKTNGGYQEFKGIDLQVTDGIIDIDTMQPCVEMDSIVDDAAFAELSCEKITWMFETEIIIQERALSVRPVTHVWAMRPELWWELTRQWFCCIQADCATAGQAGGPGLDQVIFHDSRAMQNSIDNMLNQKSLTINGNTYRVILDTGIPLLTNTTNPGDLAVGEIASGIYFLPLRIMGSTPVLYIEYKDYSSIPSIVGTSAIPGGALDYWSDDGKWLWAVQNVNWCLKVNGKIEPRVCLRTPWLAAKCVNIKVVNPLALKSAKFSS